MKSSFPFTLSFSVLSLSPHHSVVAFYLCVFLKFHPPPCDREVHGHRDLLSVTHAWYTQYHVQCLTPSRAIKNTSLSEWMNPIFATQLWGKCFLMECQTANSHHIETQVKPTRQLSVCHWLNTKVNDGAQSSQHSGNGGDDLGPYSVTKRQAQASHLEGWRKDSSQQHNQLKSLESYCFAISVLWQLLPWIKCLKAYGPRVVRYLMGTCHLCSGIRIYKCMFYTHTHYALSHLQSFLFLTPIPMFNLVLESLPF